MKARHVMSPFQLRPVGYLDIRDNDRRLEDVSAVGADSVGSGGVDVDVGGAASVTLHAGRHLDDVLVGQVE